MFTNIQRDFNKTLKAQVKEYTDQGYVYIGCFGSCQDRILKFIKQ